MQLTSLHDGVTELALSASPLCEAWYEQRMMRRVLGAIVVSGLAVFPLALFASSCSSDSDAEATEPNGGASIPTKPSRSGGATIETTETTAADLGEPWAPEDRSARPSPGCSGGSASPPVGVLKLPTGGAMGDYILTVPAMYDPTVPQSLAFVFHGADNTPATCRGGGNCSGVQGALEGHSIVIYMKSFGSSWTDAGREQNVTFFDDMLAYAEQTYCVDERRVYALGTSSGAHFTNILACRRGDKLLAAIPGAGERLEKTGCVGRVAALVIHGVDDSHVPFTAGEEARDYYAQQNGCTTETVPALSTVHTDVRAARDAAMSTHGCVDYQGCRDGLPVRWCEHSEPGYDNTTHGWPGFGGQETWDFVNALL